ISFGNNLSEFYQRKIEAPFFNHFLKGEGARPEYEALVYDCGIKKWHAFAAWPPKSAKTKKLFLQADKGIAMENKNEDSNAKLEFISDPNDPVPYRKKSDIRFAFTPRPYMSDDQRFASKRPDVLVFQTPVLTEPITLAGDILAKLNVATSGTDADWIVKLIDVYPNDYGTSNTSPTGADLNGYQQMVRSEVMRGRFRNSFEKPEAFEPGKVDSVEVPLQDVFHTFRPRHRIMVHIQSTWFPLIDRNPQTFVDNIFRAQIEDYQKAIHHVFVGGENKSYLEVKTWSKN
ncbi:MAG: CocE/NonD family hydrolase, partial [Planctomycetota bacterium]